MAMEFVHSARKQADQGLRALGRAIELFRELGAEFPRVTDYHHMTASALSNRGVLLNNSGRADEALPDLEEAIKLQRIAVAAAPDNKNYRRSLGNNLMNRLFSWKELGRHDEIARHADELAALDPESARQLQLSGAYLLMAASIASQDPTLETAERERLRDELVARGVTWLRAAMAKGFHSHQRFGGEEFGTVREHPAVLHLLDDMRTAAEKAKQ
jgi:tetratricopeptide (TPR) repeat protein